MPAYLLCKYMVAQSGRKYNTNSGNCAKKSFDKIQQNWTDGTQMPKVIEWTISPANRIEKPNAPTLASRTVDSITLSPIIEAGETQKNFIRTNLKQAYPLEQETPRGFFVFLRENNNAWE